MIETCKLTTLKIIRRMLFRFLFGCFTVVWKHLRLFSLFRWVIVHKKLRDLFIYFWFCCCFSFCILLFKYFFFFFTSCIFKSHLGVWYNVLPFEINLKSLVFGCLENDTLEKIGFPSSNKNSFELWANKEPKSANSFHDLSKAINMPLTLKKMCDTKNFFFKKIIRNFGGKYFLWLLFVGGK